MDFPGGAVKKKPQKKKPHKYIASPCGGCTTCLAAKNARIHQPLWWRLLNGQNWRTV